MTPDVSMLNEYVNRIAEKDQRISDLEAQLLKSQQELAKEKESYICNHSTLLKQALLDFDKQQKRITALEDGLRDCVALYRDYLAGKPNSYGLRKIIKLAESLLQEKPIEVE